MLKLHHLLMHSLHLSRSFCGSELNGEVLYLTHPRFLANYVFILEQTRIQLLSVISLRHKYQESK